MFKAMKITEKNLPLLAQYVSSIVYADFKAEFEFNTEDGIDTYATMQNYLNSDGRVLVYLHEGDSFNAIYMFTEPESETDFKDITTK